MTTLIEHAEEVRALRDLLEQDFDHTDEDQASLVDEWFEEINDGFERKVDGYAGLIRELKLRSEARKAEADRLARKAKRDAETARWLSDRLVAVLQGMDIKTVEGRRFKVTRKSGGIKACVVTADAESLPDEFVTVKKTPNKTAIKDALKSGWELPFAHLEEPKESLLIS